MQDEPTFVTQTAPLPGTPTSSRSRRYCLAPIQKLTRAHLAIDRRPAFRASLAEHGASVAQKLGALLKTTLSCHASLSPTTVHPFTHLAARALFATLEFGGEAIAVLEVDLLGVGALLGQITSSHEPVGLPNRLSQIEEAALGWVFLSALAELRKEKSFSRLCPRLVSLTLDRGEILRQVDARVRHVPVQLELEIGQTRCLGRLLLPSVWLQSKVDALPQETCPLPREEVSSAGINARCLLGGGLFLQSAVSALAPGDVVLLEGLSHTSGLNGSGRLLAPSFELWGSFSEAGFTLTRAFERKSQEFCMSQVDPSVPVEVEIELTRLRLPLHQLGALRPGSVLPLHINAAQQITVRIGDQAVARAELVEIEGEIGARIVTMLSRPS